MFSSSFSLATFFGGLKPVLSLSDRKHIDSDRNRSKSYLQIQDWTCGFLLTSNILLLAEFAGAEQSVVIWNLMQDFSVSTKIR